MKLLVNLILLTFISLNGSLYAQYCQCSSDGLQEVSCIEAVSKDNPCYSNCDCVAGRFCVGGWCHGKASNTNCMCILGVQTYCQEKSGSTCNPNIANPNCQCSSGRICSSYGYCVGQSENRVMSLFDVEELIEEE